MIETTFGIHSSRQALRIGFPPKDLILSTEDEKLNILGITNGETILVDEAAALRLPGDANRDRDRLNRRPERPHVLIQQIKQLDTIGLDGEIVRRIIPSDNSCLFNAFAYCLYGKKSREVSWAQNFREIVADVILDDPITYNEAVLGKSTVEYADWIQNPTSWGGDFELSILSSFYEIQINVFDIKTARIFKYGENQQYDAAAYLLYDGIHYDALVLQQDPSDLNNELKEQTLFPIADDISEMKALEYVKQLNKNHEYTDTASFNLVCLICHEKLKGETEAAKHATQTGHTSFGENR